MSHIPVLLGSLEWPSKFFLLSFLFSLFPFPLAVLWYLSFSHFSFSLSLEVTLSPHGQVLFKSPTWLCKLLFLLSYFFSILSVPSWCSLVSVVSHFLSLSLSPEVTLPLHIPVLAESQTQSAPSSRPHACSESRPNVLAWKLVNFSCCLAHVFT